MEDTGRCRASALERSKPAANRIQELRRQNIIPLNPATEDKQRMYVQQYYQAPLGTATMLEKDHKLKEIN